MPTRPKTQNKKVSKKAKYQRYAALVRDLEIRAALDTSRQLANLPLAGEAGPSNWQQTPAALDATLPQTAGPSGGEPQVDGVPVAPAMSRQRPSRDVRWPLPSDRINDDLKLIPHFLTDALQTCATARIYSDGLTYPTGEVENSLDVPQLLDIELPPGTAEAVTRVINSTLSDLAVIRGAADDKQGLDARIQWETLLHAAAIHCSPTVIKNVSDRLKHRAPLSANQTIKQLEVLAATVVRPPDLFNDLLAPLVSHKFPTYIEGRKSTVRRRRSKSPEVIPRT